ncbi:MAG: DUF397 domain-containing protein [Catenulispora sp.]|nr:DUF397 domain-containing protein [Catenulispora sp.]NUR57260.1 DUF397 domain-containing protein [Catenulispora sp.]
MTAPRDVWFKASASNGNNGGCVEVKVTDDAVLVRDSKLGDDSPVLNFTHFEWECLQAGMSNGEFDLS